jgi:hypothetical protein
MHPILKQEEDIHQWVHPSRAFRQYNTVVFFSIENFHPLHAAVYRLLIWHHLKPELVWINFFIW